MQADGDIHLALQDVDGKNAGTVSAEIPVGLKWCSNRRTSPKDYAVWEIHPVMKLEVVQ
jgi:hypothetical protein